MFGHRMAPAKNKIRRVMKTPFRLIVVSSERDLLNETAAWESLREAGMTHLHLRKPHWSRMQTEACLKWLSPELRACIHLHDYHDLAQRYGLGGIHLNARNPLPPAGYTGTVSRSCHMLAEVERYKSAFDYVFLSPVYASISKEGYSSGFGAGALRKAGESGLIDGKVVALGGVTPDKLSELRAWGFGGAAVLGALWQPYMRWTEIAALLKPWHAFKIAKDDMKIAEVEEELKALKDRGL